MKHSFSMSLVLGLLIVGCNRPADPTADAGSTTLFAPDRFHGVGLYAPQQQWSHLVDAHSSKDERRAKPIDDQIIIVTEDSRTGEVRACGDLTGYCVGMNPWNTPLTGPRRAPVDVTQHVQDMSAAPNAGVFPTKRSRRSGTKGNGLPASSNSNFAQAFIVMSER